MSGDCQGKAQGEQKQIMKRKATMVHERPRAQGRTASAQASTPQAGGMDGGGLATAGKAGHAGAFWGLPRGGGSLPGVFPAMVLNEKSS